MYLINFKTELTSLNQREVLSFNEVINTNFSRKGYTVYFLPSKVEDLGLNELRGDIEMILGEMWIAIDGDTP